MQRLFVSNEKKEEKGSQKSSASVYFYCIGKDFSYIFPFEPAYRSTHADFELTGLNLLNHSFPKGTIRLFESLSTATTVARRARKDDFCELTPRAEYIASMEHHCQVLLAEAIFKVSVDSMDHLKRAIRDEIVLGERGGVFHASIPCFETSIEHISEIASVNVAHDPDNGRGLYHAVSNLSSLSEQYLQSKRVAFKK